MYFHMVTRKKKRKYIGEHLFLEHIFGNIHFGRIYFREIYLQNLECGRFRHLQGKNEPGGV